MTRSRLIWSAGNLTPYTTKNGSYDEIKSHHYIISFDPKDAAENGLTGEHLHQTDLLAPAEKKITDREYHARRMGQKKLDERNSQLRADGLTPHKTEFQTQKDFLRSAIEDAAALSRCQEDFQNLLLEKYNVKLKVSRNRFSYLHPERSKYSTGRMLGTHYKEDYLLELFKEKAAAGFLYKNSAAVIFSMKQPSLSLTFLPFPNPHNALHMLSQSLDFRFC